jgi:hypothetical protein
MVKVTCMLAHDNGPEVAEALRLSNCTTMEVMNGSKKLCGNHLMDYHHREGKSDMEHGKLNL